MKAFETHIIVYNIFRASNTILFYYYRQRAAHCNVCFALWPFSPRFSRSRVRTIQSPHSRASAFPGHAGLNSTGKPATRIRGWAGEEGYIGQRAKTSPHLPTLSKSFLPVNRDPLQFKRVYRVIYSTAFAPLFLAVKMLEFLIRFQSFYNHHGTPLSRHKNKVIENIAFIWLLEQNQNLRILQPKIVVCMILVIYEVIKN